MAWFPRAAALFLGCWLFAFFTPLPAWVLRRLNRLSPGLAEDPVESAVPQTARCIAVLAGGFARDGRLSQRTHRRLRHGIELARHGDAELMLCGGALWANQTEAEAMAELSRTFGFSGPLHREARSLSTVENLLALSRSAPPRTILVVTCPHHLPRVRHIAKAVAATGQDGPTRPLLLPVAYPVERLPAGPAGRLALSGECLYECVVFAWLMMRGLLSRTRIVPPLSALKRPHLFSEQRSPDR
jgi:uncharacterized SAM-binding protein YcdF (DUF218 family)